MQIEPDLMFERKENRIRFHHTDAISSAQWRLIYNKFNYLNYGMPDVDSVKEYLDRGTWLNEDQSLAVLE